MFKLSLGAMGAAKDLDKDFGSTGRHLECRDSTRRNLFGHQGGY